MFVESTTTNGTHFLPFKRGAFAGMRTVTPSFIKSSHGQVKPTYEGISMFPFVFLLMSSFSIGFATTNIMPEFTPTPWMLANHADKGKDPWQIFAWCVRDAMSKHSGILKLEE